MKFLLGSALAALLVVACSAPPGVAYGGRPPVPPVKTATPAGPAGPRPSPRAAPATPSLARLIGQKLVIRMDGATPSADLLGRIRRGEIGGVILLGASITTRPALITLTRTLQAAATQGHQPTLLIAVDQEGGAIKRIPWAPPTLSPLQLGARKCASVSRAQGQATGAALHSLGINVDFAPVADVPASSASFMERQGRTFSSSATETATLADAIAGGLRSEGVVPVMKHFPGLGSATRDTDSYVVRIAASKAALAGGLRPYRTAIAHDIPMIMLSNATYSAYDVDDAAGWSHPIGVTLLRGELGFTGVTITDSLDGTARSRGVSERTLASRAAAAGTDLLLLTGSESTTNATYAALLREAQAGSLSRTMLRASYERIRTLKASL